MDALFLMRFFQLYPGLKMPFERNSVRKNLLLSAVSVGILDFLYVRWTKNLNLVEPLVMETRTWTLFFATPKYLDYMQLYKMLLEQFGYKPVKDLALAT